MYQMMIDKYARKGWLKYGMKTFSSGDRVWAAKRLKRDYEKGLGSSVGVSNPMMIKVDGGRRDGFRGNIEAKDAYMKAFAVLTPLGQRIIEKIVLNDEEITIFENTDKGKIKTFKKELSSALDCLLLHYLSKESKGRENEKCFR